MTIEHETLIATWEVGALTYKFFEVSREAVDEDSDEGPIHELTGIETRTNVRRVSERFDSAYGREFIRPGDDPVVDKAVAAAPDEVQILMGAYGFPA